jgi:hypothetical protein
MVNIAPAPSTANHLTTHMLWTMIFSSPVPGPTHTNTAHVLDMVHSHVLEMDHSHDQEGYRYQDTHILHHLFRGSRDRMALIPAMECQHPILMVLRYRRVHLMVRCP